jgi:serine/threonine-protein phosphatase 2B regulatory subunit
VDKTIMEADKDGDGKLSFEEFTMMVANTVCGQGVSPHQFGY